MSNVVLFNPDDTVVANRVLSYLVSVNTPDYITRNNAIINPDLAAVTNIDKKYWKVSGVEVVEMTQAEKDAVDVVATPYKSRVELLGEILSSVSSIEQQDRLIDALDNYPSFAIALDNDNYALARSRAQKAMDTNKLIQEDLNLIYGILPE